MLLENKIAIVYGGGGAKAPGEPMRASRRLHSRSALQEE